MALKPVSCSIGAVRQLDLWGPTAASITAEQASLPSFPIVFPTLCPRLSNTGDAAGLVQSSPPSRVSLCSSSTSHHTSPHCHPGAALTLSRCMGLGCCHLFPRHPWANKVRAHGADAVPPSLYPRYMVQHLMHPRLSPELFCQSRSYIVNPSFFFCGGRVS